MSGSEEGNSQELVIIRRRSHDDEGGHHGGVWKIAYADFMTAMMAFFLVMWLINSTDKKTLTQVATYFNPMRLTDKRPSPKGLEEPDGNEGNDSTAAKKGAKKKEGESKAAKKSEDLHPGEVRARGKPFQREMEEQERKNPTASGATAGESPRQAGGRAFRDPFDTVHRSEIVPSEPTNGRVAPAAPSAVALPPRTPSGLAPIPVTPPTEVGIAPQPAKEAEEAREAKDTKQAKDTKEAKEAKEAKEPNDAKVAMEAKDFREAQEAKEIKEAKEAEAKTAEAKAASERADAAQLEAAIKQAVSDALPGNLPNIEVTSTADGVLISLTDDYDFGMFAIASAEPRAAMVVVMDKLAKVLQTRPEPLVIRGHTDRRPYRNTATYDNWRLSAARAHMAYVMLARGGVDEKRFERIEGHADRSLRVQADPEAAQNRRIEILLRKQVQ